MHENKSIFSNEPALTEKQTSKPALTEKQTSKPALTEKPTSKPALSEKLNINKKPVFPKRAVITAGMPYGNKLLHFGHIGGVFIHADIFARFLRDRIGAENVTFVSGTDCYGSPILESYRKLQNAGGFEGNIEKYVEMNYCAQKETLEKYEIGFDFYGASALFREGEIHKEVSKDIFQKLLKNGYLKIMSTKQFYDNEYNVLLNGRQVTGKCPCLGCTSETGYADECSMGHQYMPAELIEPRSVLSNKEPILKDVSNWYFELEKWNETLRQHTVSLKTDERHRKYVVNTMEEFLKKPVIYITKKQSELLDTVKYKLPEYEEIDEGKSSVIFIFNSLEDREEARNILTGNNINIRMGKTLVPFRLSGNVEWGVPVPETSGNENLHDLTFWVWPESLWAPVSFTKTIFELKGKSDDEWEKWWKSDDAEIYQFLGEDNIYFYSLAEIAMFTALNDGTKLPFIIANNHVLFGDKKAGSSSKIKPPTADELLDYYTSDQLRIHFLGLGLSGKSASFKPKKMGGKILYDGEDTVLKEGNLLTNVYNRLLRSCFYTSQKYYNGKIILNEISGNIMEITENTVLEYENYMYYHKFHCIPNVLDTYIRNANKYWSNNMRIAENSNNEVLRKQVLSDCFYIVRVAMTLLHPVTPASCERIRKYLCLNDKVWDWKYILKTCDFFMDNRNEHIIKFIMSKEDFFEKRSDQF